MSALSRERATGDRQAFPDGSPRPVGVCVDDLAIECRTSDRAFVTLAAAAAEWRQCIAYLQRDLDLKETCLALCDQRIADLQREVGVLEAENTRLRELESTPRYWFVDHINRALKRIPFFHRALRGAVVQLVRLERARR